MNWNRIDPPYEFDGDEPTEEPVEDPDEEAFYDRLDDAIDAMKETE